MFGAGIFFCACIKRISKYSKSNRAIEFEFLFSLFAIQEIPF